METQVEELSQVLKVLRSSRHCHPPPPSLSPLSPSFSTKQQGHGNEPVQDIFVHLGWCRKHGVQARLSLLCPGTSGPLEGGSLACLQAQQPAHGMQGAEDLLETHSISFFSVSGDTPGCAKLILPDSFKTALYERFKFLSNKGINAF